MAGDHKRPPTVLKTESDFRTALRKPGEYESEVQTDPRVFERISMGLYREPASAIRELISNAYDADAEWVRVNTDQPDFSKITVEDNGVGMSPDVIKRLIRNVGGSLKQEVAGKRLGLSGKEPGLSPGGRRLIGRMGIGLYSVARLTTTFRINTKQKDSNLRYIIDFSLLPIANAEAPPVEDNKDTYVAGRVQVRTETVTSRDEIREQGTLIELNEISADARRVLQSIDRWESYDALDDARAKQKWFNWHIERRAPDGRSKVADAKLPWHNEPTEQTPLARFRAMLDALSEPEQQISSNPSIYYTLDYYLAMLWKISLSAPLDYVEKNPFDLTASSEMDFYSLKGNATPESVAPGRGVSIGRKLGVAAEGESPTPFTVEIDGLELRRPVVFRGITEDGRRLLTRPKMFVGKFSGKDDEGRPVRFAAYFYWNYQVIPKENNGILVRINGASGTLFDKEFLDFRTSEMYRLRQVSAEVFVSEGLDDALNIDRESFDDASQHFRMVQRWVHRQMTRLMTRLKADQKKATDSKREQHERTVAEAISARATELWRSRSDAAPRQRPPRVAVTSKQSSDVHADIVIRGVQAPNRLAVDRDQVFNAQLRAIVLILDSYGVLEGLSESEKTLIVGDIAEVLQAGA